MAKSLWGFDPLNLLEKTVFPNDRLEYAIRHARDARWVEHLM